VARENPIVNRLNKTKVEKHPDLREEKEARLRELRKMDQGARDARVSVYPLYLFTRYYVLLFLKKDDGCCWRFAQRKEEARVAKERKELAWQRDHAYDNMMTEDNIAMSSNQDRDEDFLDDFM
jgi:hypothetical protein